MMKKKKSNCLKCNGENMERRNITVVLPSELDNKLEAVARKDYTTKSAVIRKLISTLEVSTRRKK